MDARDGTTARSAMTVEEGRSSNSHHIKQRGRSNSLRWKKQVVYDCVKQTVKVLNEEDIGRLHALIVHVPR